MAKRKRTQGIHHPGGQPDNPEERFDASETNAFTHRAHEPGPEPDVMSSAMGGTSDAGSAADDAAESAAFDIGLPDDRTRQTSPGATPEEQRARGQDDVRRRPPRTPER